ncbi:MAG: restriction endonuclease subunit S, partial [Acidobacteria bacterium]|nr:restriction endonuclease subunit S [Acidobacteriota bacterium]
MFSGLKPYPGYKESGVPWLGRVPTHWQVKRVKALLRERSTKGFPDESLLAATQSKGVVRKKDYEVRTVTAQKDLHLLKLVDAGDFVVSLRSFQGGIERAHYRGIISPAYTVLYPRDSGDRDYLSLLFKSRRFVDGLKLFVTGIREGQNIDYQVLSRDRLPAPQQAEQAAIVKFLGHANSRIDRAIASKRKMIRLLEEQKQVEIGRLVCGELDGKSPMKESGFAWLGSIPANWEVVRAKNLFREVDERSSTGIEEQLSVSHLTGVSPRRFKSVTMFHASSYVGHKRCRPGDLVVNTMWAWMGALGVTS